MSTDPYAPYLRQADEFFSQGEITKAGQIWQAILKKNPSHTEARTGLMAVKQRLMALPRSDVTAIPPLPGPTPDPAQEPVVTPEPRPAVAVRAEPELVPVPLAESSPSSEAPQEVDSRSTAPEGASAGIPGKVTTGALAPDRFLAEGCTLYDMGQVGDALKKWELVLAMDPDHTLARGYANGARRELGLPLLQAREAQVPSQAEVHHVEEDIEKLLKEAVQLYDMGLVEEAISKWERVLVLEPQRHEVEGYLRQAQTEVDSSGSHPATAVPHAAAPPFEALDLKLRQAEHLLSLQRHEEAAFTFQQALLLAPGDARALQGLERCRNHGSRPAPGSGTPPNQASVVTLDSQGRIAMAVTEAPVSMDPQGVEPPAALLKSQPAPRQGPSLPDRLREVAETLPWLKDPKLLAGVGGGVLVLALVFGIVHSYRKDQATKEEVRASREAATASVAQQAQAPDLTETPAAIRQEAETTLSIDPLRAYLRAETLVSRNPADTAGAQLLEKARAGLTGGAAGASLAEFQKHLQSGDLEAANKVIDALLRAQPDDAGLRARAGRLHLTLCFDHASQAKWDEAQEDLLRGRALFPDDKTWQVRLRLLTRVKTLPKAQQASWIALFG